MNEESLVQTLCVPDYGPCQPQPTLRTFAAGSLYLRMLTVFSAYSALEIEVGLQANVYVMKELYIRAGSNSFLESGHYRIKIAG